MFQKNPSLKEKKIFLGKQIIKWWNWEILAISDPMKGDLGGNNLVPGNAKLLSKIQNLLLHYLLLPHHLLPVMSSEVVHDDDEDDDNDDDDDDDDVDDDHLCLAFSSIELANDLKVFSSCSTSKSPLSFFLCLK